ncbi:hypothetical protein C2S52_010256, partial [Perilla frutescens var. hirtella]
MTKTLWNIYAKKDFLWVKWVHIEYLRDRDVWSWTPHDRDSPLIKNLCEIRKELIENNGNCIDSAKKLIDHWYSLANGSSNAHNWLRRKGEKRFWKTFIPQKYSFCMWLAIRGRLATRDRLDYLGLDQ